MTNKADLIGWRYYKYAILPDIAPHQKVDRTIIDSGEIWKRTGKKVILARWTSDFDCGYETNWWYVIKDKPFDIWKLKSKRRNVINKGKSMFDVRLINPAEYKAIIYSIRQTAYAGYPQKYRPTIDQAVFYKEIDEVWSQENVKVYGAFFRESNQMVGYTVLYINDKCIELNAQKVDPAYEKYQINAALIAVILEEYKEQLENDMYICDGERNIQHETAFQDYLEKYFDFRKAYCKLNVEYPPCYRWIIKSMYYFKPLFRKLDRISIMHKINGVLRMEELVREQKKRSKI